MNTKEQTATTIADLVREHLEANKESLAQRAVEGAVEELKSQFRYEAQSEVSKQLAEFYKEHIAPELAKYLDSQREHIVATLCSAVAEHVQFVANKMSEDLAKRLSESYSRKQVVEALFGVGRGY